MTNFLTKNNYNAYKMPESSDGKERNRVTFLTKYNYNAYKMPKPSDGKKETTKEQQEENNNAIAKGKYLDIMRIIEKILNGNEGEATRSEEYITISLLTNKLRISNEVASIIQQRLFDNGIIDSIETGKIVKTKDEFETIMAEYLKENLFYIKESEQTR